MQAHLYPTLALNTEGDYLYLKNTWRNGTSGKWFPGDGEPGFTARQLNAMRYQHAIIGINTETSELMQLFFGDYLATLDAPLDKAEAIKELGDIMWYCSLAYQALLTFVIPTSPRFPVSQAAVIRFTDVVNYAQAKSDGMQPSSVITARMDLAVSAQHAGNLLLKWFKNACFYGQVREQHEIETQLALIISHVAKLARLLGSNISEVLDINIDKLRRRYPEGFNGQDAVAQADESPGYKSVSDRTVWSKEDTARVYDDLVMLSHQEGQKRLDLAYEKAMKSLNPNAVPQFHSKEFSENMEKKAGKPAGMLIDNTDRPPDCSPDRPAVDQIVGKEKAGEPIGLLIDNTFDQSTLPDPSDKSDIECLRAETLREEVARLAHARLEAVLADLTTEDIEVLTTVIRAVKKAHTTVDITAIGEELGRFTSQLYNVATALGWSEPVDHSGNLPSQPLS